VVFVDNYCFIGITQFSRHIQQPPGPSLSVNRKQRNILPTPALLNNILDIAPDTFSIS
jgi:hypothetical protein